MGTTTRSILTISHQYGSGGSRIARDLGQRLQWTVWEKEIVRKIATQYQVSEEYIEAKDERVDSFIERMVGLFGMGGFESAYEVPPPLWLTDAQLARMTRGIMEEVAKDGQAVIVGRAGNFVLADHPRSLHVFIFAPLPVRIERVMEAEGLARAAAEQRIAGMDKIRADYVRTFYHADWRDPGRYHFAIDSGVWEESGTADLIAWALERAH
ncbi:MAG: cytidylate kinase-like family protein [Deltaproteobacteria bacterium]|nr:cytidylate kinase-like family protein [Deltaproteobacteria bacterium]